MEATVRQFEIGIQDECDDTAQRAANARRVNVVEVFTGMLHELPGDTATRDARTLSHFSHPSGAVLPLVMRPPGTEFYVCSEAWPELAAALVRRCS